MPRSNWYFLPNQATLIKYSMWGKVRFVEVYPIIYKTERPVLAAGSTGRCNILFLE